MHITILQRDVLQQVLDDIRVRYAGYHVSRISESWCDSEQKSLIENGVWHGYYEKLGVRWNFELTKRAADYKGPNRFAITVSPVFDIVFADVYPKMFVIEVGFEGFPDRESRPTLHKVEGIEGQIWDVHYFYDAALRDL